MHAISFEVKGSAISLTQSGVNMAGKQESSTLTLQADGEEHAVSPQAPGVVVVTTWLDSQTLETIGKKGADIVGCGTHQVSADGLTLGENLWDRREGGLVRAGHRV